MDLTIKHEGLAKLAQQKGTSSFDIQTTTSSALGTVSPSQNSNSDSNTNNNVVANGAGSGDRDESSQASQHSSSSKYGVFVAKTGDISDGAASTGGILRELGQLELRKKDGYGDLFTEFQDFNIWDHIGRASTSDGNHGGSSLRDYISYANVIDLYCTSGHRSGLGKLNPRSKGSFSAWTRHLSWCHRKERGSLE